MNGDEILKQAVEAKKLILEGQMTLWNTRLESLISSGDLRAALDQLRAPLEDSIDNCGCNVQCGGFQAERIGLGQPQPPVKG
jgi:hypothetical protein